MITTLSSDASLISTSIQDDDTKNIVLYIIGIITIFNSIYKKFYNAEEKAAENGAISKQFGSFYDITIRYE